MGAKKLRLPNLFRLIGIDTAVAYVIFAKGWSVFAGLFSIYLVSRYLSGIEQGFFYTFNSIVGLQIFFELGLGLVITQFASHEMSAVNWKDKTKLVGPEDRILRLYSIIRFATKWYGVVAPLAVLLIVPLGLVFFRSTDVSTGIANWGPAWLTLVVFSCLNLFLSPLVSFAEGIGLVAEVAKLRFVQAVAGSILLWIALSSGMGLLATAAMPLTVFLLSCGWLYKRLGPLVITAWRTPSRTSNDVSWRTEIMPMQWRIAVSWLCGYFIYQLFTPLTFRFNGAEVAGKLGMSMAITSALSAVALSWISTKMPLFGRLASVGNMGELDLAYGKAFLQSIGVLISLCVTLIIASAAVPYIDLRLSQRILGTGEFIALSIVAISSHIIFCQASYIRAFKLELYLPHAVILAATVATCCSLLAIYGGVNSMLWGYALSMVVVGVGYSNLIFNRFRRSQTRY